MGKRNLSSSELNVLMLDENSEKKTKTLMDHERDGGHTLSKHVRNNLDIFHDKRREKTYISYFKSAECAEEYISRAMSANKDAIASWSSKAASRARRAFEYNFDTAVGFGVDPQNQTTTELYSVLVVLEKKENGEEVILTSYPVRRKIGSSSCPSGEQSWRTKQLSTEEKLKEELKRPNSQECIFSSYPVQRQTKFGSRSSPSGEQSWRSKQLSTEEKLKEEQKRPNSQECIFSSYPVRRQTKFGSRSSPSEPQSWRSKSGPRISDI